MAIAEYTPILISSGQPHNGEWTGKKLTDIRITHIPDGVRTFIHLGYMDGGEFKGIFAMKIPTSDKDNAQAIADSMMIMLNDARAEG